MQFNVTQIDFDFTDDQEADVPLDCQQKRSKIVSVVGKHVMKMI